MNKEEYHQKKDEVIAKFTPDFMERYKFDAPFMAILEMLILDANPYELIERLIEDRKEMTDKMKSLIELLPPSPRIIKT